VRDNETGFNPAYQHKLFGVFQQLSSDKQFGGLGIGLALVRRIVIKLGGEVFAEGQVVRGQHSPKKQLKVVDQGLYA